MTFREVSGNLRRYNVTLTLTQPKFIVSPAAVTFRPGTSADAYGVYEITELALADLDQRTGLAKAEEIPDAGTVASAWPEHRSLYQHLADAAENFWVAERAGRLIGFARSMKHDDMRELTEFFVLPGEQSAGIGRSLLARAFPKEGAIRRCIIATTDARAQARYLKVGVYPRFPIYYFGRKPRRLTPATDLTIKPVTAAPETLAIMADLDRTILEYQRDIHHTWFFSNRQGFLYYRGEQPVGYGYIGRWNGPFVLLNSHDFPAVLAHAESEAANQGQNEFGLDVPLINRGAVDYLLAGGYRMGSFIVYLMSDKPFGKFENYINTSPMFFL